MDFNTSEPDRRNVKTDMLMSALLAVVAVIVYGSTLTKGVFPGESASWMAVVSGFDSLAGPVHPLFTAISTWLSGLPFSTLPVRLNTFSMLCAVLAVVLLYRVTAFFIRDMTTEEEAYERAPRVSAMAGGLAGLAFLFSMPLWAAGTRFQYQSFDVLFPLLAAQMLVYFSLYRWRVFLVLFAVIFGVGVVEAPAFIPGMGVLFLFAMFVLWRTKAMSYQLLAWLFGLIALVFGLTFYLTARGFFRTEVCASLGMETVGQVMLQMLKIAVQQVSASCKPKGMILLLLLSGAAPWLTALGIAFRGLNNERSISQYGMHLALGVLTLCALSGTPLSPWNVHLESRQGILPVGQYAMVAMTAGYVFAYLYLLLKVRSHNRTYEVSRRVRKWGEWLGVLCTYPFAVLVIAISLMNTLENSSKRGLFADHCASEILKRMGTRTWLVTDGMLDAHLQIMAKEQGVELNLLCLPKENNLPYLRKLWQRMEEQQIFSEADAQPMRNTLLGLGMLPFIHDWFEQDDAVETKVAVFGFPDLWFSKGLEPAPDFFMFCGTRDKKDFLGKPLLNEYMAFWQGMDAHLSVSGKRNSDMRYAANRLRKELRRHMGFVASNLGFLLEELGNDKDALAAYNYVSKSIDADNISALFNRFEMVRRDSGATKAQKDLIEKELREFLEQLQGKRYSMWSLSRYYGYVRSPEIFVQMAGQWAASGHPDAARQSIKMTIELLPEEQRQAAIRAFANTLIAIGDTTEAEQTYNNILRDDPNDRTAIRGKARLAMLEGAFDKAKTLLEQITNSEDRSGALAVEWATIHLMNTNVVQARLTLQEATDLNPKNLQALSMLALLQLQQGELDEVDILLNRMRNAAGTDDNYFLLITRGQLLLRRLADLSREPLPSERVERNPEEARAKRLMALRTQAREAFARAMMLRPDIHGVKDMVLQLDIELSDTKNAQLHARQVLRQNRDHALANYVMGSLRLQEGAYGEAEDFLRRSVNTGGTPAALNDLAEVLRRIRRLDDAEKFAREAVAKAPKLYIAWETLGSVLLEANRNLDEAEDSVKMALSLLDSGNSPIVDPRVNITLARIQLKKGDIERARATIQKIEAQKSELARFDLDVLAKLREEAKAFQR
ncbi:MAG: tetratricopeptide repeat protein [Kiritimatiellaeota bacterium]|nr:tetratricopeptide repeat protein [Kiritimatiellota bacterium]